MLFLSHLGNPCQCLSASVSRIASDSIFTWIFASMSQLIPLIFLIAFIWSENNILLFSIHLVINQFKGRTKSPSIDIAKFRVHHFMNPLREMKALPALRVFDYKQFDFLFLFGIFESGSWTLYDYRMNVLQRAHIGTVEHFAE